MKSLNIASNKFRLAFTLAEILSVLVILGIVAIMTVPTVIQRVKERQQKTSILKGMATFEEFVNEFLLENGITNEQQAADLYNASDDCEFITKYFNVKRERDRRDRCIFDTYDGLTWTFEVETFDDKENFYKYGLAARVEFTDGSKIKINGHEIELPDGEKADYFRFYFHSENGIVYVNDPEHVPWYHWQGTNWCGSHPFGHGCWSGMLEYDATALLPWQYLKMVEYKKYNYNF